MADLRSTQQAFMDFILQGEMQNKAELPFVSLIEQGQGIGVDKRAEIYFNAYRSRFWETIETDHEMLGLFLGDDLFERMANGYIASNPSGFRSLRQYCDALPEYLKQDEFFSQYPVISDLAAFERRLLTSFDAADAERSQFAELQVIDPELWPGLSFRFHPSTQLFECNTNAVESWQALKAGRAPEADENRGRRYWLVWRGEERLTEFRSLSEPEYRMLQGFVRGESFQQQCELMLNWCDEQLAAQQVLMAIQNWFAAGIISSINC